MPRATLEELMEFANKVREAGGGNPLDALMPSVPENPKACLIARNLNFNCQVQGAAGMLDTWVMVVDEPIRSRIAAALDLEISESDGGVFLPDNIGQIASDFDEAGRALADLYLEADHMDEEDASVRLSEAWKCAFPEDKALIQGFLPYIKASEDEAYDLASHIDEKGRITF